MMIWLKSIYVIFPHPKFRGDSSVKIFKLVNSDTEYDEQIKKIVMV